MGTGGRRVPAPVSRLFPAADRIVLGGVALVVALLVAPPLVFLAGRSVTGPDGPTIANFAAAYGGAGAFAVVSNSLQYALGTAAFALCAGTALAWINERTNAPFKTLVFAAALAPLAIPNMLLAIAWALLASPRIGLINAALGAMLGIEGAALDIYSIAGMVWVDGLHETPFAFLMMTAAFRASDSALEEAARASGASTARVLGRITLRLVAPALAALFALLVVRALESFETPALLGMPAGLPVLTSAIYEALGRYPSDLGLASAHGTVLVAVALLGVFAQAHATRQPARFATLTGRGGQRGLVDLGRWRGAACALCLAYVFVAIVLPVAVLVWASLQPFYAVPSRAALERASLAAYRAVVARQGLGGALANSVFLAGATATLVMALASLVAWISVMTRIRGRWLLDGIATVPIAIPGIVLGLAIMLGSLAMGGALYGTIWILLIAYLCRFLPHGVRASSISMLRIGPELVESAATSGASWSLTMRRVVLPLLRPGLLAGWLYVAIVALRELSSSIVLYSPGTEVVAVVVWDFWQNGQMAETAACGVMLMAALAGLLVAARSLGLRVAGPI